MTKMSTGHLLLHRSLLEKEFYKKPVARSLFIHLLLTVNIKESEVNGVKLPVGARVTSLPGLAKELGFSVKQIRAGLEALKRAGSVAVTRHSKFSVITVENWASYQAKGQSRGQSNGQAKGQQNEQEIRNEQEIGMNKESPSDFEKALEAFRHNQ